jgi:serine/threonine protein kinase
MLTIILKPGFAPPEQYEKVNAQGPWTDIYAIGATLYYMITGIKPEESTNRRISDTLASPREISDQIPENISNTIMKAMAIDKHMRFLTVDEFEKALLGGKMVLSVAKEKKRRWLRRLITALAAALVIGAGAFVFLMNLNEQREAETLPTTTLSFWYAAEAGDAKEAAYTAILQEFNDSFPNVTIETETFPQFDYREQLRAAIEAGNGPVLFESNGTDEFLEDAVSVADVIRSIDSGRYNFLDSYGDWFPDEKRLPLGFVAPLFYANDSLAASEAEYP